MNIKQSQSNPHLSAYLGLSTKDKYEKDVKFELRDDEVALSISHQYAFMSHDDFKKFIKEVKSIIENQIGVL